MDIAIAAASFRRLQPLEGAPGGVQFGKRHDHAATRRADPSPASHQRVFAEQSRMHIEFVVAPHVARGVDAFKVERKISGAIHRLEGRGKSACCPTHKLNQSARD
ncbi:hypothetical protein GGD83_004899 [Rhodoblastus sphagnicola]|nr:hypothetical protein [Rhodoblastus sphagnicola]